MDNDGRESERATNKLVLFLANVEKDSMVQGLSKPELDGNRNVVHSKPIF
jgi:hypothetical protein